MTQSTNRVRLSPESFLDGTDKAAIPSQGFHGEDGHGENE